MIINNKILNAVLHCHYKAYLKKISQPSIKTEFETIVERLKEKQKSTIETNQITFKNNGTFNQLLNEVKAGKLLHCDETTFKIETEKIYVWVFTNMNTVCYMIKPTREAEFLKELFVDFKGVLISDFYAGYDALDCPKQRCLIHLPKSFFVRNINVFGSLSSMLPFVRQKDSNSPLSLQMRCNLKP